MDELVKAIMAKYKSTAGDTLRALTGDNLWLQSAAQIASGMWLVLTVASNGMDHVMGSSTMFTEDFTASFRLCSSSSMNDCMTALPLLTALYDDVMLTLTGYTCILAQRTRTWPTRDFETEGYVVYVDYHYIVGH